MRIFYVSAIEQRAPWGAEIAMNRELQALGHDTHTLDFRSNRWRLADQFLLTPDFDVLLLQRGDYFPVPLVRACNRPRVFWATELVARRRDQMALLRSQAFNRVFVRTPRCRDELIRRGWVERDDVEVLRSAFDPSMHRPLASVAKDIDVLFVGTLSRRRRNILHKLLREFGRQIQVHSAFGEDMVRLCNRARIVLNLHAEAHLDTETRVYEVLGCGSFLLTERLSEESPFVSGEHLAEVATTEDLADSVRYYLERSDERDIIAQQGHQFARSEHTYNARARQIVRALRHYLEWQPPVGPALDRSSVEAFRKFQRVSALVPQSIAAARIAWQRLRTLIAHDKPAF